MSTLDRRQMLGGLLAFPFIPSFLRKSKPSEAPKPYLMARSFGKQCHLDIISDTTTNVNRCPKCHAETDWPKSEIVAKFAELGVITSIKIQTKDMKRPCEILPPESTIVVGCGEVLVVAIRHYPHAIQTVIESTFILTRSQESSDRLMDSGICGFVPHTRQEVPFRYNWETHQIEYYEKLDLPKNRLIGLGDMCWTNDQSKQYSRLMKIRFKHA